MTSKLYEEAKPPSTKWIENGFSDLSESIDNKKTSS